MAINRFDDLGIIRNLNLFKKVEPPPVKTEQPVTHAENLSKRSEVGLAGHLQKQAILAKFTGGACTPDPVKPEIPQNYSEIDKQADELIKKHTDSGFFGDSLKPNDLGPELAQIAKTDPDRASALTDNILDKIDGGDKDEIAQSFVESMSPAELREYAKTEKGKETLGKLRNHLDEGWTTGDEYATMAKIDTTVKAADFERSCEFKNLSPEAQKEVLSRLDANQGNTKAVDNLVKLASDANFSKLPLESQKTVLKAFDKHKEDTVFTDALVKTAGKAEFQTLSEAGKATVINDIEKFANTESYKDADEAEDRPYLISLVGDMSAYSIKNPSIVSVRNSLNKVLNEEIKLETMNDPSKNGFITYGKADDNTMYMNRHPDAQAGIENSIDTFVHEVNHIVNGESDYDTPDRFFDEYRARIVGREAKGETFSAEIEKEALDTLAKSGAYSALKDLYDTNPEFKAVIDKAYDGLSKNPPELTSPSQLRQKLLDAGFNTDYLKTVPNLDNHKFNNLRIGKIKCSY